MSLFLNVLLSFSSVFQPIYPSLPDQLFICPSFSQSICLFTQMPFFLSLHVCFSPSIHLSLNNYLSVHLSVSPSVCLPKCPSFYLSLCFSVSSLFDAFIRYRDKINFMNTSPRSIAKKQLLVCILFQ